MIKKIQDFWHALVHLPEIYTEFKNISKLLATMENIEKLLVNPAFSESLKHGAFEDILSVVEETDEKKIEERYAGAAKAKLIEEVILKLHNQRSIVSGTPAAGSREIRAKNAAVMEIDQQIHRLKVEHDKFTQAKTVEVS